MEAFAVRARRAEQLGSRCNGHPELVAGTLPNLVAMLDGESNDVVLEAIADALGDMWDPATLPHLIALGDQPSPSVQAAVARALGGALCNDERQEGIELLLELSARPDPDTRDWATMHLASLEADDVSIREALWARVDDTDCDADGEALCGLAARKDPAVGAVIAERLSGRGPGNLIVEAAGELADPSLLPLLQARRDGLAY